MLIYIYCRSESINTCGWVPSFSFLFDGLPESLGRWYILLSRRTTPQQSYAPQTDNCTKWDEMELADYQMIINANCIKQHTMSKLLYAPQSLWNETAQKPKKIYAPQTGKQKKSRQFMICNLPWTNCISEGKITDFFSISQNSCHLIFFQIYFCTNFVLIFIKLRCIWDLMANFGTNEVCTLKWNKHQLLNYDFPSLSLKSNCLLK